MKSAPGSVFGCLIVIAVFAGLFSGCGKSGSGAQSGDKTAEQEIPSAWTIGVLTGSSPFHLSAPQGVANPVLRGEDVSDMEINIVAHPFLVVRDGSYYMYFTAKHDKLKQGGIGLARSSDGLNWEYVRMVIDEPFDLAYPYVFQWEGEYYMIPEAYTETAVRLYRAVQFPDVWEYERDIITGDNFISPTVFEYGDMWWMYVARLGNETLRLFYADGPMGPWTEHPRSPIVEKDLNTARPAGTPLVIDGVLYRIAQDCEPTYGNRVIAFEVTELTTTSYAERMLEQPLWEIQPAQWNSDAAHQVDAHRLEDGSWIAAVDALGR